MIRFLLILFLLFFLWRIVKIIKRLIERKIDYSGHNANKRYSFEDIEEAKFEEMPLNNGKEEKPKNEEIK